MSLSRLQTAVRIDCDSWQSTVPDLSKKCREAVHAAWTMGRTALDSAHPLAGPLSAPIEVSVLFSSDAFIQKLNHRHLGKDSPTNVLSFPGDDNAIGESEILLGDVILAWETVQSEAALAHKSLVDHATHMVIHGVLHLLGYDHDCEIEAEIMERLEVDSLALLGIPNPYEGER